jgi:hypothetical protein
MRKVGQNRIAGHEPVGLLVLDWLFFPSAPAIFLPLGAARIAHPFVYSSR